MIIYNSLSPTIIAILEPLRGKTVTEQLPFLSNPPLDNLPIVPNDQAIEFAIKCVNMVCSNTDYLNWADRYLSNQDITSDSALNVQLLIKSSIPALWDTNISEAESYEAASRILSSIIYKDASDIWAAAAIEAAIRSSDIELDLESILNG